MKEKILITGYNGELGSKTLKKLVSIGKSVIALDINDPKEKIHSVKYIKASPKTRLTKTFKGFSHVSKSMLR